MDGREHGGNEREKQRNLYWLSQWRVFPILMIGIYKAVERGKVRVEDNHLKIFTAALAALLMYESVEFSNPGH